jgi:Anti-sigma-K factor rskA
VRAPDFDELVGDVPSAERERLRRAHDLLVAAGPPPELPASISSPPVREFPRRRSATLLIAAAIAALAFAAGWILNSGDDFEVRDSVPMHATANAPGAAALLELGYGDGDGNWPMVVKVQGLKPLPKGGYYELLLTKKGKPVAVCGSFKVKAEGQTEVRLGASYDLKNFDGWVVRPYIHGRDKFNRTVVLTTIRT